jgi:predicted O-methyltransferase YrrM
MSSISKAIDHYLEHLAIPDDPILKEMARHAEEVSFPYVGPLVGQLLYVLASAINAQRVLEIGSGFGYSAYWFCKAVGPEGEVHLTEKDAPDAAKAEEFLTRAGFADRIQLHRGEADELLLNIAGEFDVIFIDCRKREYPYFLDRCLSRLRIGGLLIADNVLWHGKVAHEAAPDDRDTLALQEFNQKIFHEPRLRSMIVPLRDGVSISVKVD